MHTRSNHDGRRIRAGTTALLAMALLILSTQAMAQSFTSCIDPDDHSIFLAEDFESGQGGWSISAGVWEIGEPAHYSVRSGTQCAGTVLGGNYPYAANARLISPEIVLPADPRDGTIQLQYWHLFSLSDDGDYSRVEVSRDGGGFELVGSTMRRWSQWSLCMVDLSEYAGSSIRIAFHLVDDTGHPSTTARGWYIDDVAVYDGRFEFRSPEDFDYKNQGEVCWRGWYATRGVWQIGVPTHPEWGPDPHDGRYCAGTYLESDYPHHAASSLRSPLIDVPDDPIAGEVWLTFWHWFNFSGDGDIGRVDLWTQADGWTTVSDDFYHYGGVWSPFIIDLADHAGETIRIRFAIVDDPNYPSTTAQGWYIDDVALVEGPLFFNNPSRFEGHAAGWAPNRGIWQFGEPTHGPAECSSPPYCWGTRLHSNYVSHSRSTLDSPWIRLPDEGTEPLELRFQHWYSFSGDGDYGVVGVRTEQETFTEISSRFYHSSSVWSQYSIDLRDYAGMNVQFRFYLVDDPNYPGTVGPGWFIDDVEITGMDQSEPVGMIPQSIDVAYSGEPPIIEWFYLPFAAEYIAVYATLAENGDESVLDEHQPSLASRVALLAGDSMSFVDEQRPGFWYLYRISLVDSLGHEGPAEYPWPVGVPDDGAGPPARPGVELVGNHPNPFNPTTEISFRISGDADVTLEIFDLSGKKIATLIDERLVSGTHRVPFTPQGLASGVYVCRLTAGPEVHSGKMLLLK